MKNQTSAVVALIILCACGRETTSPARGRQPSPDATLRAAMATGGFHIRVRPAIVGGAAMNRMPSNLPRIDVSMAIAPAAQLGGGIAVAVRDPDAAYRKLVVFSQEAVLAAKDDGLYLAARDLFAFDEKAAPGATGRRVLTLYPDLKVRLDAGGKVMWARMRFKVVNPSHTAIPEMVRRGQSGRELNVEGIGKVRLVFDENDPPAMIAP